MSEKTPKHIPLKGKPWDWKREEVLKSEYLDRYQKLHKDVWERIIRIDNSLIILESIMGFPFGYFITDDKKAFWQLIYWNSLHMVVVFAHGLINDNKKDDTWTLPKLKNCLLNSWVKDEHKAQFSEYVEKAKFDHHAKHIGKKIAIMRSKYIAHRLLDKSRQLPIKSVPGVSISQLRKFLESTKELFNACSFGSYYETRMLDFITEKTVGGKPVQSHLEDIFDLIVKNSCFLYEPEKTAPYWQEVRKQKSEDALEILNRYRKKFGMPEA